MHTGSGSPPYSHGAAGATWRLSFGLLIPVILYFLYYRVFVLRELKALDRSKKKNKVDGKELNVPLPTSSSFCKDNSKVSVSMLLLLKVALVLNRGAPRVATWLMSSFRPLSCFKDNKSLAI